MLYFLQETWVKYKKQEMSSNNNRKIALVKSFKELKLVELGKLKAKSATALLKELRNVNTK